MRLMLLISVGVMAAAAASAQTRPTQPVQPLGPVPSGGVVAVRPTDQAGLAPSRRILFIPQFAPPGTQVPGGPPASNVPTLITPTVLGLR